MEINKQQFASFKERASTNFLSRLSLHVRTAHPEVYYSLSTERLQIGLEAGINRANKYGLFDEFAVTRFIDYLLALGWTFDESENYRWIVRILRDNERSELCKIADIDNLLFGSALEEPFR